MKNIFNISALLIGCCLAVQLQAQQHYVVTVDRLKNDRKYTKMDLENGRPVEKPISKPALEKGDILTVRLINFNELVYGMEVESKLIEKRNLTERLMANPLIDQVKKSPTVEQLLTILSDPPRSRGEEGALSINSVHKNYVNVLTKIKRTEDELNIVFDEGATLTEIKTKVAVISSKHNPKEIEGDLEELKKDIELLKATDNSPLLDEIADGAEEIESLSENGFLHDKYNVKNLKKLLAKVDFIQEKTIIIGKDERDDDEFEKFITYVFIYKRADEITSVDKLTKKPYSFDDYSEGEKAGDFLRQFMVVDLKMRDTKRPFWSLGIHRVFIPTNTYSYNLEYNYDYFGNDSLRFVPNRVGGGRTVVGTDINFRLPLKNSLFNTYFSLGLAMAFSDSPGKKAFELDDNQAFVTTGLAFRPNKLSNFSLRTGMAWSKQQMISKNYKANVWYEDNFTEDEFDQIINKKIKPAFMIGLSLKL